MDADFSRARQHVVRHGPLPYSKTPTADVLDGDYDNSSFVLGPLAAIKFGRDLAAQSHGEWQTRYYDALYRAGQRYTNMAAKQKVWDAGLNKFCAEFMDGVLHHQPIAKLNRWLGFIQASLITAGETTVQAERDWTRPLFRPLDFDLDPLQIDITSDWQGEHWSVEQVKRHVIAAIVEHEKTKALAVAARRAADKIIRLLRPTDQHKDMAV